VPKKKTQTESNRTRRMTEPATAHAGGRKTEVSRKKNMTEHKVVGISGKSSWKYEGSHRRKGIIRLTGVIACWSGREREREP